MIISDGKEQRRTEQTRPDQNRAKQRNAAQHGTGAGERWRWSLSLQNAVKCMAIHDKRNSQPHALTHTLSISTYHHRPISLAPRWQ